MKFRKNLSLFLLLILIVLLSGCATRTKKQIRESNTKEEQLLLIRNLMYYHQYKDAIEMFTYVKEQDPENIALKVEVDYEIAFCYWKRKEYKKAKEQFEALIAYYDNNNLGDEILKWPYNLSKKILNDKVLPKLNK